jgi:hypothetical protein
MVSPNDGLRLPPPWITPAAGMPDREVRPVIIVQRRRLLYPAYVQHYLDRVTAADVAAGNTSGLELGVTDGANTFIQDLVSDTYLGVSGGVISQAASVIKASVPMAGARTRLGAMTPLVGPAPTSFNFGDGDYNRKTGQLGNGLNKYLDGNYAIPAANQNNAHMACRASSISGAPQTLLADNVGGTGLTATNISVDAGTGRVFSRLNQLNQNTTNEAPTESVYGVSRSGSASYSLRFNGSTRSVTESSATPAGFNISLFSRTQAPTAFFAGRIAFYSIGESLDLAILDARVTALINAYAAAIP